MALFGISFCWAYAQQTEDSLQTKELNEVIIRSNQFKFSEHLPAIQGTRIWAGKKNEVINVQNNDVSVADKTPRQIFSRVPGVFVYDMDGTGNQTNISTRGLDPHRGWEYNTRKNGVITNSDMYGYPASHYSMPMEAVERIELIRGTGSLQYGAQFGGMLNYVSKRPDSTRRIMFESINTVGSFNMLSTYNALGGTIGKFQYYVYYNRRSSDGYRDNSETDYEAQSLLLIYSPHKNIQIKGEVAHSKYTYKIPGPLTDSMFHADPTKSTRSRNYFNPDIYVPSITIDWKLSSRTTLQWITSAVLGDRNSVMFDKPATTADVISPVTMQYANRQVDIDHFNSYTSEITMIHRYNLGGGSHIISGGVQVFNNHLHRTQLGKGTTGSDFDLSLIDGAWGRDLHFKTKNIALFVENSFNILPGLLITPGFRFEAGYSDLTGQISYYNDGELPTTIGHQFPLFGVSADYKLNNSQNFYAGWSQAYRPVIFKDIIPASTYEVIDKNLEDAQGYNLEIGYRGSAGDFKWDVSVFQLRYDNRMGSLEQTNPDNGLTYIFRTNIGGSRTNGVELFGEYSHQFNNEWSLILFTSTALFDATYKGAELRSGKNAGGSSSSENLDISGNRIEAVPEVITRNGISVKYNIASLSLLYSYTDESFADPLNTVTPSASGAVGLVPSYGILDMNASIRISTNFMIRLNVNNIANKRYFTKRPSFYPGPGIWPSDGRSMNITLAIKV